MSENLDRKGSPVTIKRDDDIGAYTVSYEDSGIVGRSFFKNSESEEKSRIFYHVEVNEEFGGRGLASLLVNASLEEAIRDSITVVPLCPVYVGYLDKNGQDFVATGGSFRAANREEKVMISKLVRKSK
ncbi:MAG TPA: GNAT family N-acetyltransferase [Microbacteriaceae bacterium]|nr:GNAT family N-acetyltransferase [Microbacteriaceae bacterium]